MSDKKYIVRIKVPNMPVESKEKLKHLAENLGFDSVSELCKTKLKENLKKYGDFSPLDKPYKPYWFDSYTTNNRLILKENKDL